MAHCLKCLVLACDLAGWRLLLELEISLWKGVYSMSICAMYIHTYFVSWMIKVMYILGLVFGVFAGLITAAFSFIPSLNSPVYLVCDALVEVHCTLVALYCICDLSPAS